MGWGGETLRPSIPALLRVHKKKGANLLKLLDFFLLTEMVQLSLQVAGFFESLGWKVFRVPETATVLMSGGIAFGELNQEQVMDFQVSILKGTASAMTTYDRNTYRN